MPRRKKTEEEIKRSAIGLIDSRQTDNDGLLIKRDRSVTMVDIFGTEQKTAVAYYVSDLLAKGFNNQQIIETVKKKYDLDWKMRDVNIVKALLHKMWRCEIAHTMNDQIAREIATIDTQVKEAWSAWEFSKKGIKRTKNRNEKSKGDSPEMTYDVTEVITEEDTCAGEVKFLQHINELGKEKRKLLGLYAPEKKEESKGNNNIQFNIVGEGASSQAADLMSAIMNMGNLPNFEEAESEVVEEKKEPVPVEVQDEIDIDQMMQEMMV